MIIEDFFKASPDNFQRLVAVHKRSEKAADSNS